MNEQKMTWRHIMFAIACGALMGVGCGMLFNAAGVFYPHVATEFGFLNDEGKPNTGPVGLWLTICFIGTTILLPFAGRLLEKYDARLLYTIAAIVLVVAFFINSAAPGIWAFYVAGALMSWPSAFILYLIPVLVSRWFVKRVGFITGLISSMSGIGAAIWNIVAANMITASGWRAGYIFYALANLIVCVPLTLLFVRSKPEDVGIMPYGYSADQENADDLAAKAEEARLATKGAFFKDVIKSPVFYFFAIQGFCGGLFAGINQFIPTYANYTLAGNEAAIALIGASMTSATMIANLVGKIVYASFTDKNPLWGVIGVTVIPAISLFLLRFVANADSSAMFFLVCGFIYGLCNPAAVLVLPLTVRKALGDKEYGKIWGSMSPVAALAAGFGFTIWGFVASATSFDVVWMAGAAVVALELICFIIAWNGAKSIPQSTVAEDEGKATPSAA